MRALDALPADIDTDPVPAERQLVDQAADHDAKPLRVLGRRLVEVDRPRGSEAHEAQLLEREEQKAATAAG